MIAALNPCRLFDDSYRSFINLTAGQIGAAIGYAHAYEEERRRAEALAEIDRAKTTFFSNVSHEFRTPLTLMLGPLEELLAKPNPAASPAAEASSSASDDRELIEVTHRNGLRLLKLVNALLDFSRIEAGRMQIKSSRPTSAQVHRRTRIAVPARQWRRRACSSKWTCAHAGIVVRTGSRNVGKGRDESAVERVQVHVLRGRSRSR